jgi:hypothetical protein
MPRRYAVKQAAQLRFESRMRTTTCRGRWVLGQKRETEATAGNTVLLKSELLKLDSLIKK